MEENMQPQEDFSLLAMLKILLRKIKVLIIALLIGVIVGGGFGFIQTANVKYYGTKIDFYVNPRKVSGPNSDNNSQYGVYGAYGLHVMDNMVTLLNSELFAERLTLNADGLPCDEEGKAYVNDATLQEKVNVALAAKKALDDAQKDITAKEEGIQAAEKAYAEANTAYVNAVQSSELAEKLYNSKNSLCESAKTQCINFWRSATGEFNTLGNPKDPEQKLTAAEKEAYGKLYETWELLAEELNEANKELTGSQEQEKTAKETVELKAAALEDAKNALVDAQETLRVASLTLQEKTSEAVESWRQTPGFSALVNSYQQNVSFSFYNEVSDLNNLTELARSFIYVHISVLNDEALAKVLYDKVIEIVPIFVEENMAIPSGYDGTNCRRITRNDAIHQTNAGYTTKTAFTYAAALGAVSLLAAAVIVIILDRSDKRLRNYEIIMQSFDVPVLGVIPSIDMDGLKKDGQDMKGGDA